MLLCFHVYGLFEEHRLPSNYVKLCTCLWCHAVSLCEGRFLLEDDTSTHHIENYPPHPPKKENCSSCDFHERMWTWVCVFESDDLVLKLISVGLAVELWCVGGGWEGMHPFKDGNMCLCSCNMQSTKILKLLAKWGHFWDMWHKGRLDPNAARKERVRITGGTSLGWLA